MTAESLEDILKGIGNVVFRPPLTHYDAPDGAIHDR